MSNEPGYYKTGDFGIRIENLLKVVDAGEGKVTPDGRPFHKFEKLTMIPIQKSLIDQSLMTKSELDWLDDYHLLVWNTVGPRMQGGGEGEKWLRRACEAIERE